MGESSTRRNLYGATALIAFAIATLGGIELYGLINKPKPIIPIAVDEEDLLNKVFPDAGVFSAKSGLYPSHKAYTTDPDSGATTLVGFFFLTTDVEPEERAYGGHIDILVGMTRRAAPLPMGSGPSGRALRGELPESPLSPETPDIVSLRS
jgi:hypothetical protein